MDTKTSLLAATLFAFVLVNNSWAAGGLSVDARFDLTDDGIVDASDWQRMTEDTKHAYANESVKALGEDPYAILEGQQTRGDRFLTGLRSVYE